MLSGSPCRTLAASTASLPNVALCDAAEDALWTAKASPLASGLPSSSSFAKLLALEHLAALLAAEAPLTCNPMLPGAEERDTLSCAPGPGASPGPTMATADARHLEVASSRTRLEVDSLARLLESWSPPSMLLAVPALLRTLLRGARRGHVWSSTDCADALCCLT